MFYQFHLNQLDVLKISAISREKAIQTNSGSIINSNSIIRDLVIIKSLQSANNLCSISNQSHSELKAISEKLNVKTIFSWQAYLKGSETQNRQSLQPRLWIEILLLGIMASQENTKNNVSISRNINNEVENFNSSKPIIKYLLTKLLRIKVSQIYY